MEITDRPFLKSFSVDWEGLDRGRREAAGSLGQGRQEGRYGPWEVHQRSLGARDCGDGLHAGGLQRSCHPEHPPCDHAVHYAPGLPRLLQRSNIRVGPTLRSAAFPEHAKH